MFLASGHVWVVTANADQQRSAGGDIGWRQRRLKLRRDWLGVRGRRKRGEGGKLGIRRIRTLERTSRDVRIEMSWLEARREARMFAFLYCWETRETVGC